jgi:hypothetical protein
VQGRGGLRGSTSIYPLQAVACRQGGGAVSPMVVVGCRAIVELLGIVSGDVAGLRGGKGTYLMTTPSHRTPDPLPPSFQLPVDCRTFRLYGEVS